MNCKNAMDCGRLEKFGDTMHYEFRMGCGDVEIFDDAMGCGYVMGYGGAENFGDPMGCTYVMEFGHLMGFGDAMHCVCTTSGCINFIEAAITEVTITTVPFTDAAITDTTFTDAPIGGTATIVMDMPIKFRELKCRYVSLGFNHNSSLFQPGRFKNTGGRDAMLCV